MGVIVEALHWLGFGLCHQLPERSFFGGGVQVPVCARDEGIYLGFVVSLLVIAFFERGRRRSGIPPWWVLGIGGLFVAVMGLDGVTSYAGLRATTNDIRLITGLMAGWALPLVVAPVLNDQLWPASEPGKVLGTWRETAAWLAALPVAFVIARWGLPLLGVGLPLLVAVAIFVTFTCVNLMLVTLARPFERTAARLRDAWPAILFGLALTALEVGLSALLRQALLSLARLG